MTDQEYIKLLDQHNQLLQQLIVMQGQVNFVWVAIVLLVFFQVCLIVAMLWAAVWSVSRVMKSNTERMAQLESQWMDHKKEIRSALDLIVRTLRGGYAGNIPS